MDCFIYGDILHNEMQPQHILSTNPNISEIMKNRFLNGQAKLHIETLEQLWEELHRVLLGMCVSVLSNLK